MMIRRYLHSMGNVVAPLAKRKTILQRELEKDVFIVNYPGTRIIELSYPHSGNIITSKIVTKISRHLANYVDNVAVSLIFFSSCDPKMFSKGLDQYNNPDFLNQMHDLSLTIGGLRQQTLSVYGGDVPGSSFGIFANTKYRLGTSDTTLSLPELSTKGQFPIGGIAHFLVNSCPEGLPVSRLLGFSGKKLGVDALYSMKLLSHVVEKDPQTSICDGLSRINLTETKEVQTEAVDVSLLPDILDSMNGSYSLDLSEEDKKELDRSFLIPVQPLDAVPPPEGLLDQDIFSSFAAIDYCFSEDSLSEVAKRLSKFAPKDGSKNWATMSLDGIESMNPKAAESWLYLTRVAETSKKLRDVLEAEKKLI